MTLNFLQRSEFASRSCRVQTFSATRTCWRCSRRTFSCGCCGGAAELPSTSRIATANSTSFSLRCRANWSRRPKHKHWSEVNPGGLGDCPEGTRGNGRGRKWADGMDSKPDVKLKKKQRRKSVRSEPSRAPSNRFGVCGITPAGLWEAKGAVHCFISSAGLISWWTSG